MQLFYLSLERKHAHVETLHVTSLQVVRKRFRIALSGVPTGVRF